ANVTWDVDAALLLSGSGGAVQAVRTMLARRTIAAEAGAAGERIVQEELSNLVANGSSYFTGSRIIQKDTTVQLTEEVVLTSGQVVPKGSVVTVNGDAMKIVQPDGNVMTGSYSRAVAEVKGLPGGGEKGTLNTTLIDELAANGVKFTPENVIAVGRSPSGQVVFLETGSSKAGLQHIIEEHGSQFVQMGVSEAQIPGVVMKAVTEGKLVGYQGSGLGRPIYELVINGEPQRIAVTVGNNGFIVGANPRGSMK
ncbi:hypothetical protein SAMN05216186_1291, partial [Pseudomonas indica]